MQIQKFILLIVAFWVLGINSLRATGAPSTYFNIYLPPNNDAVKRNVALIITAIYDDTQFTITDDDADGDSDDTVTGTLAAGQSYVLYIKDNGINDDAQYASGGVLKRDGDYFIIRSSNLVFASMSTDSDWQHDFVPSVNKTSLGGKFIIYAPKISNSKRDLNIFAFEDNTTFTISQISTVPTTNTGYTNIDMAQKTIVKQGTLNRGQDIIHYFQDGRDVMETGATYMIETNKSVSVQYGALWGGARDGGGYVPSSNGSSSGELFYFAVPYQADGEQEIRVVSWDDNNNVILERYDKGGWINVASWNLNRKKPGDWVGKRNGNATYPTVFRISCTSGKKVSVFECNWMETGTIGTSDMASMVSSEAGTDSGNEFLVYLLPPSRQINVVNPFTSQPFGDNFTHCYIYAGNKAANVTIKDAKTNGTVLNRTYTIQPNRYVDAYFSEAEWKSIYNGTGNPDTGPDRPYILIESNHNVSVMSANTNDNWMMYFGSSLEKSFSQSGEPSQDTAIPGDTITYTSDLVLGNQNISNPKVEVIIGSGCVPISSELTIGDQTYQGQIISSNTDTHISFNNLPTINSNNDVSVVADVVMSPSFNDGMPIPNNTVITIESVVTGTVNGQIQQSSISSGIQNNTANQSNLSFTKCVSGNLADVITDTWNTAWVDYNNDGWEDLFIPDIDPARPNLLYRSDGTSFTKVTTGPLVNNPEKTVSSAWGDYNNDGFTDVFIVNATGTRSRLYKNNNGSFAEVNNSGIDVDPQYFHGAAWFDMDNDGFLDLIITNFFETRFHQMYRNNGNGTFTRIIDNPIVTESNRSTMPALADYNNDGLVDIFIPNGQNKPNSLFKNLGNSNFEKITTGALVTDLGNSVGAAWGDYNNDGYVDLLVLNASKQPDVLYKNLGNGSFEKVANSILSEPYADTHSAAWIDHDNDSDLDIFITNDEGVSFYYINNGDETFTRKLAEMITSDIGNAMGIATADYNKDGNVDMFVSTHSDQKNSLYCNQSDDNNNFINIRLVGVNSNKSAIGAKIKVGYNGVTQYREVLPVQGLGSQNSLRQHFGMNKSDIADVIEITWPSGYIQTIYETSVNQFLTITEENGNRISGFAFSDDNNNCNRDEGEDKIENIRFSVGDNSTVLTSRKEGAFELNVAGGSVYEFSLLDNDFWKMECTSEVVTRGNNNSHVLNLPLKKVVNAADLGVGFGITAWRRGFANESLLQYFNQGTTTATNCVLELTYPEGITLVSASIPWSEKVGNKYIWNIAEVPAGKEFAIQLVDSVTLSVVVGQVLDVSAKISTTTLEPNTINNTYSETLEVVGAIDPNDLLVTPKGKGAEGFISNDQVLKYHIRFQNVGTYYASRVVLENQLSPYLDWSTFKIESVSHERYNYALLDNGLLEVKFNNIELPDSTTNEAASHGFFIYTIKPKASLKGGERIENSVLIAFDYEDPLRTNTVVNTIKYSEKPETGNLTIFPNPAADVVNITGDSDELVAGMPSIHTVRIVNALGNTVSQINNKEVYQIPINVQHLSPGIYTMFGYGYDGKIYQGKLVKM